MLNNRNSPSLAFYEEEPNFENLEWFLAELQKDFSKGAGGPATGSEKRTEQTQSELPSDFIEEALSNLKDHPNCQNAWFLASRSSFKVKSKDKRQKIHEDACASIMVQGNKHGSRIQVEKIRKH